MIDSIKNMIPAFSTILPSPVPFAASAGAGLVTSAIAPFGTGASVTVFTASAGAAVAFPVRLTVAVATAGTVIVPQGPPHVSEHEDHADEHYRKYYKLLYHNMLFKSIKRHFLSGISGSRKSKPAPRCKAPRKRANASLPHAVWPPKSPHTANSGARKPSGRMP